MIKAIHTEIFNPSEKSLIDFLSDRVRSVAYPHSSLILSFHHNKLATRTAVASFNIISFILSLAVELGCFSRPALPYYLEICSRFIFSFPEMASLTNGSPFIKMQLVINEA